MLERVRGPALDLAVFRVSVFTVILGAPEVRDAVRFANLPPALRVAPYGLGWLAPHLPASPALAQAAVALLLGASALALVGLWTRAATLLAALAGAYALTLPQLAGSVLHNHHLLWFMALLAASPCGDALSLDAALVAWRTGQRGRPPPSAAYGLPVRAAWLLVGLIFLFPGLWKWRTSGLAWALSDNLRNQMYWKWYELGDFQPLFRVDRYPGLCRAGALAVLLFEPAFILALPFRWLRPLAVAAALLFHAGTQAFLGIAFSTLWACYTVFVPWEALLRRLGERLGRRPPEPAPIPGRSAWPAAMVALVLVVGNVACGLQGIDQGWPFAAYPLFDQVAGEALPGLAVAALEADGSERPVALPEPAGQAGQRRWGQLWALLGQAGAPGGQARLAAYAAQALPPGSRGPRGLRLYRTWRSVVPEERGRLLRAELLAELP